MNRRIFPLNNQTFLACYDDGTIARGGLGGWAIIAEVNPLDAVGADATIRDGVLTWSNADGVILTLTGRDVVASQVVAPEFEQLRVWEEERRQQKAAQYREQAETAANEKLSRAQAAEAEARKLRKAAKEYGEDASALENAIATAGAPLTSLVSRITGRMKEDREARRREADRKLTTGR